MKFQTRAGKQSGLPVKVKHFYLVDPGLRINLDQTHKITPLPNMVRIAISALAHNHPPEPTKRVRHGGFTGKELI